MAPARTDLPGEPGRDQAQASGRSVEGRPGIVFFADMKWDFHNKEPQIRMQHMARLGYRIIYVDSLGVRELRWSHVPHAIRRLRRNIEGIRQVVPGLHLYAPLQLPFRRNPLVGRLNRAWLRRDLQRMTARIGLDSYVLWVRFPYPEVVDLIGSLGESLVIYEAVDNYAAHRDYDARTRALVEQYERFLLAKANLVIYAPYALWEARQHGGKASHHVPVGVDVERFSHPAPCPPELSRLAHPLIGYVGTVDALLDYQTLAWLARTRPQWSFVYVGGIVGSRPPGSLTECPNVHFLGPRDYETLPGYVQQFDVCLAPHVINDWTTLCFPGKTLQYLAAGRPVVSAAIPSVRSLGAVVRIASTCQEYLNAIEASLQEGPSCESLRVEVARRYGYDTIASRLDRLVQAQMEERRRAG